MKKSRTSFKRESLLLISYSQETTQLSFFQTIITIVRKELIALEKKGFSLPQGKAISYTTPLTRNIRSITKLKPLYLKPLVYKGLFLKCLWI